MNFPKHTFLVLRSELEIEGESCEVRIGFSLTVVAGMIKIEISEEELLDIWCPEICSWDRKREKERIVYHLLFLLHSALK